MRGNEIVFVVVVVVVVDDDDRLAPVAGEPSKQTRRARRIDRRWRQRCRSWARQSRKNDRVEQPVETGDKDT